MICKGFLLPAVMSLLLIACGGQAKPLIEVVRDEVGGPGVELIGRAGSCKMVSIPAKSACGPGLLCNPNTGTCVPDGHHLKKYFLGKMFNYSKVPVIHLNSLDKSKPGKLQEYDIKLQRSPWS